MTANLHLETWYPERIPVTERTLNCLPYELRLFYSRRQISELAARCLLNHSLRTRRKGKAGGALTLEEHDRRWFVWRAAGYKRKSA